MLILYPIVSGHAYHFITGDGCARIIENTFKDNRLLKEYLLTGGNEFNDNWSRTFN